MALPHARIRTIFASADERDLEDRWARAWDEATRTWPRVAVDCEEFAAFVAERLDPGARWPASLDKLFVADLYLALGCARGDAAAAAAFVTQFTPDIDGVHARHPQRESREDFRQRVCEYLLVAHEPGRAPRIERYGGRGKLRYWIRVVASRLLRRVPDPAEMAAGGFWVPAPGDPLDVVYLRSRYRTSVQAAVTAAFVALTARQRQVLRYRWVEQLPVSVIALVLGVHRATASRWLRDARSDLLAETQTRLRGDLGLGHIEVGSLLRLLRSHLSLSVDRLLRDA